MRDRRGVSAIVRWGLAAALVVAWLPLLTGGCSVMVFPEGPRSRDGRVGPFSNGAFHLAVRAGVPVLPIALDGSRARLGRDSARTGRDVRVRVFPPIETRDLGRGEVGV